MHSQVWGSVTRVFQEGSVSKSQILPPKMFHSQIGLGSIAHYITSETYRVPDHTGLAKNFFCFLVFSCMMALLVLSRLTPFETIFVRLNCDSSHISMHFFKVKKLVNFCVVILILKMEENMMLYYFKTGKNATKTHTHKDLCSLWRRCWD